MCDCSMHSYDCAHLKSTVFCFYSLEGKLLVRHVDLSNRFPTLATRTDLAVSEQKAFGIIACTVKSAILVLASAPGGHWPSMALLLHPRHATTVGSCASDVLIQQLEIQDDSMFACPPSCTCVKSAVEYAPGRVLVSWGHGTRFLDVVLSGLRIRVSDLRIRCPRSNDLRTSLLCPGVGRVVALGSAKDRTSAVEITPLDSHCTCKALKPLISPIPFGSATVLLGPDLVLVLGGYDSLRRKKAYFYSLNDETSFELPLTHELAKKAPRVPWPAVYCIDGVLSCCSAGKTVQIPLSALLDCIVSQTVRRNPKALAQVPCVLKTPTAAASRAFYTRTLRSEVGAERGRVMSAKTSVTPKSDLHCCGDAGRVVRFADSLPTHCDPDLPGEKRRWVDALRKVFADMQKELSRSVILSTGVLSLPAFQFSRNPFLAPDAATLCLLKDMANYLRKASCLRRNYMSYNVFSGSSFLLECAQHSKGSRASLSTWKLALLVGDCIERGMLSLSLCRQALARCSPYPDTCGPGRPCTHKILSADRFFDIGTAVSQLRIFLKPMQMEYPISATAVRGSGASHSLPCNVSWPSYPAIVHLCDVFDPLSRELMHASSNSVRAQLTIWRGISRADSLECSPHALLTTVQNLSGLCRHRQRHSAQP